jgi:hypothetical protein
MTHDLPADDPGRLSLEPSEPQQRFVVESDARAGAHSRADTPIRRNKRPQSVELTATRLTELDLPLDWTEQQLLAS